MSLFSFSYSSLRPYLSFAILFSLLPGGLLQRNKDNFMVLGTSDFSFQISRSNLVTPFRGNMEFFGDVITWAQYQTEGVAILSISDALNSSSVPFIECRLTSGNYSAGEWMYFHWVIDSFNVRCGLQDKRRPNQIRFVADNTIPVDAPQLWRVRIHSGRVQACISKLRVRQNKSNYDVSCQNSDSLPPSLSLEGVTCGCARAPNDTSGVDLSTETTGFGGTTVAGSSDGTGLLGLDQLSGSSAGQQPTTSLTTKLTTVTSATESETVSSGVILKNAVGENFDEDLPTSITSEPTARTKRSSLASKETTVTADSELFSASETIASPTESLPQEETLNALLNSLPTSSVTVESNSFTEAISTSDDAPTPAEPTTIAERRVTVIPVDSRVDGNGDAATNGTSTRFTAPLADDPTDQPLSEDGTTIPAESTVTDGNGPVVGGPTSSPTAGSPTPVASESTALSESTVTTAVETTEDSTVTTTTSTTSVTTTTTTVTEAPTTTTTVTLAPTTTSSTVSTTTTMITLPPRSTTTPYIPPTLNITSTTVSTTTRDPRDCGAVYCIRGSCDEKREECNCPSEEGNHWTGANCNIRVVCDFEPCKNQGKCEEVLSDAAPQVATNSSYSCACAGNYGGTNCTEKLMSAGEIAALVLCVIIFLCILIAAIFLFRFVRKSRKLKGKYNPAKEEMASGNGPPLPMVDINREERLI